MRKVIHKIANYISRITTPQIHKTVEAKVVRLATNELLKGRCAFITGGTSGIGYSICEAMLDAGAKVIIGGRDAVKCAKTCNKLIEQDVTRKDRVDFVIIDLSISNDYDKVVGEILSKTQTLDILVNNAGTLGCQFGHGTEADFDKVIDTNLRSVFMLSQAVAKYFKNHGIAGNILNIGSSSSYRPAASAYTLSKWGIRGLTLGMGKTLIKYNIVVNGIAPGPTATPMLLADGDTNINLPSNPLGRYAMPDEIGNMAVILTSEVGRTVVGAIVPMTGGAGIITYDDMKYEF